MLLVSIIWQSGSAGHIHISPFFDLFPIQIPTEHYAEFLVLCSSFSLVICFTNSVNSLCMSIPICQLIPLPFPFGVHMFVIYICVSISALQIGSSVPFFQIPHISINIYFFLSDLLHSISQSLGPSMSLQKTQFWSFLWLSNIPLYICTSSLLKSFIPEASEPLVELPANSSSKVSLDVNTGLGSPGRLPRTPIIPYPSILQCLSTTYFPFLISWSRFIFELISYHFCLFVTYWL